MHTPRPYRLLDRAMRHMEKAVVRGDVDASWRWSLVAERQLDIALKLVGLDPDDNRLRRFRPALFAMRQMILVAKAIEARNETAAGDESARSAAKPPG